MPALNLKEFIEETVDLPPVAQILPKLLPILKDPESSIDDVIQLLKLDLALSAKILQYATSSYYGLSTYAIGLEAAVQRIGLKEVSRLVVIAASKSLLDKPLDSYDLEPGELFQDSLATAQVMHSLCSQLNEQQTDVYYTTGLLHSVGKTVIDEYLKDRGLSLYGGLSLNGAPTTQSNPTATVTLEFERKILGFNHAEAGAILLKHWGFGPGMTESIARQYIPKLDDPNPRMSHCLNYANSFGPVFRKGEEGLLDLNIPQNLLLVTGLPEIDIRAATVTAYHEFEKVQEMLKN